MRHYSSDEEEEKDHHRRQELSFNTQERRTRQRQQERRRRRRLMPKSISLFSFIMHYIHHHHFVLLLFYLMILLSDDGGLLLTNKNKNNKNKNNNNNKHKNKNSFVYVYSLQDIFVYDDNPRYRDYPAWNNPRKYVLRGPKQWNMLTEAEWEAQDAVVGGIYPWEDETKYIRWSNNECRNSVLHGKGNTRMRLFQSPLVLQPDLKCEDEHRMRGKNKHKCEFDNIRFHTTDHSLRAHFIGCNRQPTLDFSHMPSFFTLHYMEIKSPSEHVVRVNSKQYRRYDAEITFAHRGQESTTLKDDILNVGILVKADSDEPHKAYEKFLKKFERFQRRQYRKCNIPWYFEYLCQLKRRYGGNNKRGRKMMMRRREEENNNNNSSSGWNATTTATTFMSFKNLTNNNNDIIALRGSKTKVTIMESNHFYNNTNDKKWRNDDDYNKYNGDINADYYDYDDEIILEPNDMYLDWNDTNYDDDDDDDDNDDFFDEDEHADEMHRMLKPYYMYDEFFPGRFYWRYQGSTTTPPCYEHVKWRILRKPLHITYDQLNRTEYLLSKHLNSRCEFATVGKKRRGDGSCKVNTNRPLQQRSYAHRLQQCDVWNGAKGNT